MQGGCSAQMSVVAYSLTGILLCYLAKVHPCGDQGLQPYRSPSCRDGKNKILRRVIDGKKGHSWVHLLHPGPCWGHSAIWRSLIKYRYCILKDCTPSLQSITSELMLQLHLLSGRCSSTLSEWQLLDRVSIMQPINLMVMGLPWTSSL